MKGQEKVVGPYLPQLASQCLRLAQGPGLPLDILAS